VVEVEQVDHGSVLPLEKIDLQFAHESSRGQPKIITHHNQALHPPAVALAQCLHQFRVSFLMFCVQPLLELVDHEEDFLVSCNLRI
jgi:hypothetical protein